MSVEALAVIRPSDWELPLFVHVLGAMAMVGALMLALIYLVPAWRGGGLDSLRLGYRTLLWAALPSFIVMRVGSEWIYDKQGWADTDSEPDWLGIGYIISDLGFLLMVAATIVAGVAVRRATRASTAVGTASTRVPTAIVSLLIVMYVVAIWAMTTKPGG